MCTHRPYGINARCSKAPSGQPPHTPTSMLASSSPSSTSSINCGALNYFFSPLQAHSNLWLSTPFQQHFCSAFMATSKLLLAWLLISAFAFCLVQSVAHDRSATSGERSLLQTSVPNVPIIDDVAKCGPACGTRCSRSWKPKMCLKLCGICCSKCMCVPPGTSAEGRAVCPCYANMKAPNGKLKCP